jgi:hypothetical protein
MMYSNLYVKMLRLTQLRLGVLQGNVSAFRRMTVLFNRPRTLNVAARNGLDPRNRTSIEPAAFHRYAVQIAPEVGRCFPRRKWLFILSPHSRKTCARSS